MSEIGRPRLEIFDPDKWLDLVEAYFNCDEVALGLELLDRAPSWYRENVPERARKLREQIHRQLWTPVQYVGLYGTMQVSEQEALAGWSHRYDAIERVVVDALTKGRDVHVSELAPGAHILPAGLRAKGHAFTYEPVSLDPMPTKPVPADGAFHVFVCLETIEHLWNPWEIFQNYLKLDRPADAVVISTPLHTYAGGFPDWHSRPLGHIKCFSPASLHACVSRMFQGYEWSVELSDVIVLIGKKS